MASKADGKTSEVDRVHIESKRKVKARFFTEEAGGVVYRAIECGNLTAYFAPDEALAGVSNWGIKIK